MGNPLQKQKRADLSLPPSYREAVWFNQRMAATTP